MKQYDIVWANMPAPIGRRPVLLLTRTPAYEYLANVIAVEVTSTIRGIAQEVPLGLARGCASGRWPIATTCMLYRNACSGNESASCPHLASGKSNVRSDMHSIGRNSKCSKARVVERLQNVYPSTSAIR